MLLLTAPICSRAFAPATRIKTTPRDGSRASGGTDSGRQERRRRRPRVRGGGLRLGARGRVVRLRPGHRVARAAALQGATTPVAIRVLLAYGLKVTAYQALRDREKHYRDAVLPLFRALEKDTKCPFTRTTHKIPLVAGVASCWRSTPRRYVFSRQRAAAPRRYCICWCGRGGGANCPDRRGRAQFAAKRRAPDRPCTTGLWRVSRHVRYAADVVLHGAVAVAAALSAPSAATALLAVVAAARHGEYRPRGDGVPDGRRAPRLPRRRAGGVRGGDAATLHT